MKCQTPYCNLKAKRRRIGDFVGILCDKHFRFAKAFGVATKDKLVFPV